MEGGGLQLAAYGEQDIYLTGNPQMTYFVGVYKRYTNFATEQYRETFNGTFDFGKTVTCKITRLGDLIHRMYVWIHLPGLQQDPTQPCYSASWINIIGHAMVEQVEIEIGGVVIDRQYGVWMEIWNELSLPQDKQYGLYDMIGKHEYFNSTMQTGEQYLFVPLQFWFCRNIGAALPLVAIQFHEVLIRMRVRNFEQCWCSSDGTLRGGPYNVLDAFLYVDHIFLDEAERRVFVNKKHTYLIEQTQIYTEGISRNAVYQQINLDFNHPVKEVFWVFQHESQTAGTKETGSDLFNYSDRTGVDNGVPQDPMLGARLQIEGNDLMKERLNKYFRVWVPHEYHTRVPHNFIYCYSFCIYPEDWKPSGTINMSRIDTFTLNVHLKAGIPSAQINVFALNYNLLRIEGGMAGVIYTN